MFLVNGLLSCVQLGSIVADANALHQDYSTYQNLKRRYTRNEKIVLSIALVSFVAAAILGAMGRFGGYAGCMEPAMYCLGASIGLGTIVLYTYSKRIISKWPGVSNKTKMALWVGIVLLVTGAASLILFRALTHCGFRHVYLASNISLGVAGAGGLVYTAAVYHANDELRSRFSPLIAIGSLMGTSQSSDW